RQQDDVLADRDHAHADPCRHRGGLLPTNGEDRSAGGLGRRHRERHAGHLPACPRDRAEARRVEACRLRPRDGSAAVRADARQHGRRNGSTRRRAAPRGGSEGAGLMPWRSPDRHGITPQNKGRYDGYDVLAQVDTWDELTAGVVLARLAPFTDLSFFDMTENAIAGALCDLLLNQDGEPRIPVVGLIDQRLALGETDGWHYADLPEDGEAW